MEGWIKISRDISEHWIWQDAERLKWWFDLLFLAAWKDKEVIHDSHLFTLRRGQIIASISFLSERWGKSNPTIIKYLKLLENEGMVYRQTLYRQTPIITICNYDKYQVLDNAAVNTIIDRQVDTIVDTIVDTNKEYKNIYTISSSIKGEPKNFEFVAELKKQQIWLNQMSMRFHITEDEIKRRLDDFALDCDCRGTSHRNFNDTRKHFNDWLRIQLEAEKRKTNVQNKPKSEDRRRNTEIEATSWQDYKTTF